MTIEADNVEESQEKEIFSEVQPARTMERKRIEEWKEHKKTPDWAFNGLLIHFPRMSELSEHDYDQAVTQVYETPITTR